MVTQPSTAAPRNKLVIRRLPPTLPEDIFWQSVSTWITDKTCLWKRFVKGKAGDSNYDSHPVYSRAYVLMADPESLVNFHRAEFQAVIEYAPFQKTPLKTKVKVDNRQGTIDEDPDYLSFIESLNAPVTKPALEVAAPVTQPTTTPLLEHLRSQKSASKSKSKAAKAAQNQSQSSTATPESARRAAALASINAASQRRGGQANSGPVMVAGKGREVMITPSSTPPVPDSGKQKQQREQQTQQGAKHEQTDKEKKSRGGRKRNKGKDKQNVGVNGVPSGRQTPSVPRTSSTTPQAPLSGRPVQPARIDNFVSNMPSQNQSVPAPKTASGSARAPQAPAGKSAAGAGNSGEPRGSESGRGRQRSGRGRGGGGQPKASSAGPQVKILSRNPAPPVAPGARRGDGGGAASDAGAAFARIDM
ncbi:hypothetical protein I314_01651 [Cryptococcus bacillisporus CA1873]|uniref:UPF3 domain-containing protein n=1 Tax=Cryptococcus bacillisporus CA1873 TaxID=1296111 RepID=A0ABR5BG33_CRYGA|nr:hypothetical protein I314_01651 [Cryptococcus bacillisporus CA1873]|eukprot:KIR68157.1 hypothetical protein I314_01651 [Cryptococcus gattii CA1873]